MARNPIERIFGVIKKRWRILTMPIQYSPTAQAQIVTALCALHNFIMVHAQDVEVPRYKNLCCGDDFQAAERGVGGSLNAERQAAEHMRYMLSTSMWDDYQEELAQRNS
jgi:hypothetical protein